MLRKMIKSFSGWFVIWGVSWLIQSLRWLDQGRAFVIIFCLKYMITALFYDISGRMICGVGDPIGFTISRTGTVKILAIIILIFMSWICTLMFPTVSFTIAFQMIAFFNCINISDNNSDEEYDYY